MKCSLCWILFFVAIVCTSATSDDDQKVSDNFYLTEDENESLSNNQATIEQEPSPLPIVAAQTRRAKVGQIDNNIKNNNNNIIPTGQQSPINSAFEMIDLVTKLTTQTNEVYKAATKLANKNGMSSVDPVTFIPSIIIYGAIKAVSYLVSMFIYASSLIAPWQIDPNAKLSFIDLESLHNIDYDYVSNSVRSVPERSFKLLDIREEGCKSRAMCEIGQQIHSYWPRVATYIRLAVEQLNVHDNNTGAILRGLGWADCDATFRQSCPRSPFRKFYQILSSLNKLLYSSHT